MVSESAAGNEAPLPKRVSRCPNCGASSSAIHRWAESSALWRAACSRCDHAWTEAVQRTFFDTVFPSGDLVVASIALGVGIFGVGLIVFTLLSLVLRVSDSAAFAATIAVCMLSLIVIGRMRHDV
jgi:hypothetical protein